MNTFKDMKFISLILIFLTISCNTVEPDPGIEFKGTAEYVDTEDGHRIFKAFDYQNANQSSYIAIPITALPVEPRYKGNFYIEALCHEFTSVCSVIKISDIVHKYP